MALFRGYFFNCPVIEIQGQTFSVREYFLEDIIQLLNFQVTNFMSTNRRQILKNHQCQEEDDDLGYEDSQGDENEVCLNLKLFSYKALRASNYFILFINYSFVENIFLFFKY